MPSCKVCGVETDGKIRLGIKACEACKRFFLRNRLAIPSNLGENDHKCTGLGETGVGQSGYVWRHMCKLCRLKKCIDCGMNPAPVAVLAPYLLSRKDRPTFPPSTASNNDAEQDVAELSQLHNSFPVHPPNLELIENENFCRSITQNALRLFNELGLYMPQTKDEPSNNIIDTREGYWGAGMSSFSVLLRSNLLFVKGMKHYKCLSLDERCQLFPSSLMKSYMIWSAMRYHEKPTAMGFTSEALKGAIKLFPELEFTVIESQNLRTHFETWQPSILECSVLLASQFFHLRNHNESSNVAQEALKNFRSVIRPERLEDIDAALNHLDAAANRRLVAYRSILERYPELRQTNNVFDSAVFWMRDHLTGNQLS